MDRRMGMVRCFARGRGEDAAHPPKRHPGACRETAMGCGGPEILITKGVKLEGTGRFFTSVQNTPMI